MRTRVSRICFRASEGGSHEPSIEHAGGVDRFAARFASKEKSRIDLTTIVSPEFKEAVITMLRQIGVARQDGWHATSREAGLFWLKVMREKIVAKG
jgi:hypothetical protein